MAEPSAVDSETVLDRALLRAWEIWTVGNERDDGPELERLAPQLEAAGYAVRDEGSLVIAEKGYKRLQQIHPDLKPREPRAGDILFALYHWRVKRPLTQLKQSLGRRS